MYGKLIILDNNQIKQIKYHFTPTKFFLNDTVQGCNEIRLLYTSKGIINCYNFFGM